MLNRLETTENLANMLVQSRERVGKTQKYMSKALGKSIGTIQNWEQGYSIPNFVETCIWLGTLGLNESRYILGVLHPEYCDMLSASDKKIKSKLLYYWENVASVIEIRQMMFLISGDTGSSFPEQLNMMTILDQETMRTRVNVAQMIYDSYIMESAMGFSLKNAKANENVDNLKSAIQRGKEAVLAGRNSYSSIKTE